MALAPSPMLAMNVLRFLSALGLSAATLAAHAVVIDFEGLSGTNIGNYTTHGGTVDAQGFRFACMEFGSWNPISTSETTFSNYTGSTALFDNADSPSITLTKIGGGTFSLLSMDLANVYRQSSLPGSQTVSFTGTFADSSTIAQTFVTSASDALQASVFNGFTNVTKVEWKFEVGSYHQFDNVAIDAVPEPATVAVLTLGLVGAIRRRRTR